MPTFDVTSTDVQRFRQFIDELRRTLRVSDRPFVMQQAARLPPQVDNPDQMNLVLQNGNRQVTLILRTDNLFAIGFRNGQGQAYEFLHDNNRANMIPRSMPLRFSGSYTGGIAPLDETEIDPDDRRRWRRIATLGRSVVQVSIDRLSAYNGIDSPVTRRALRLLIVNFIESIRLNDIADRVDSLMRNPHGDIREQQLTERDISLIRDWGDLSIALTIAANDTQGRPSTAFFRHFAYIHIFNAYQAAVALGMVLIATDHRRRFRRSVSTTGNGAFDSTGLMLVEVIGVLINDIDGEDPGDLYGTISITDCFGTVRLFNRDKSNTQSVGPGGWADITWPSRAVSGADDFAINVHLMDHDSFPDLSPDDEVARARLFWNSRDALSHECDTLQRKRVRGANGSVDVLYAVLTDSVVAAVKVIMVDGDGEDVPDVYGTITATTRTAAEASLQYKLFDKKRGQDVGVKTNTAIPLQRSVMSAALCSELRVDANLWDADRFPDLSPDDQIAQGSATFRPRVDGNDNAEIKGMSGRVRVEITWSVSFVSF